MVSCRDLMHLYIVVYQWSLYMLDIRGLGVAVAGELWCFPVVGLFIASCINSTSEEQPDDGHLKAETCSCQ